MSEIKTKSSKPVTELVNNPVFQGIVDSFYGKKKCKILNVATLNKDTDYLIANKYNVTQVSPNNINDIEPNNQFDIALVTYLNKQINNEVEREDLLYQISERIYNQGYIFVTISRSSKVVLGSDIIYNDKNFTTYLI